MLYLRAAILAALFIRCIALPAAAQDVTLRTPDAGFEISGTFLGFDGEFYRLDTRYGELTLDGRGLDCLGPGCPSLTGYVAEISVSGSATVGAVLMPALIEAFALRSGLDARRDDDDETHITYTLLGRGDGMPVARFFFRVTNTDEGFADLLADEADIVMSLREVRPSEVALAREIGLGDLTDANRSRVLALDAVIPIVAATNPVQDVSLRDLARVLSGEVRNWAVLGGPDAPIRLHLRDEPSGVSQWIEDRLLDPAGLTLTPDLLRHDSNEALDRAVAGDPHGLGLATFSEVSAARALGLTGACGFSLRGTRRTIKTEDYPLTAPMFLYMPARRLPKIGRDFLAFTRSPPAQIVIRRAGFVDQAPEEIGVDLQGDRFANAIRVARGETGLTELQRMTDALAPMRRLSTSFRFEAGSSRLDAQSRSNVQQLARAIEEGQYNGRSIRFVGFSDGEGAADQNLAIAQRRAETVRDAVMQATEQRGQTEIDIGTDAFGEAMPMACDETIWGRQVNRRVEVWVR